MADHKCFECGAQGPDNQPLVHEDGCPLAHTSIVDKRGDRTKAPEQPAEDDPEALTEEERDRILAEQAAAEVDAEPSPYGGAGFQGETDEDAQKPVQTMFLVIVHSDGTALAQWDLDEIDKYLPLMPASSRQIYRACAEIMLDIASMASAEATLTALENRTAAIAEQARAAQRAGIQQTVREKTRGH